MRRKIGNVGEWVTNNIAFDAEPCGESAENGASFACDRFVLHERPETIEAE